MARAIIATILKKAAEGDFGEPVKKLYWAMDGKKTWAAIVIGFLSGVLKSAVDSGACAHLGLTAECDAIGQSIAQAGLWTAGGLAVLGQVGGGLKTQAPKKG